MTRKRLALAYAALLLLSHGARRWTAATETELSGTAGRSLLVSPVAVAGASSDSEPIRVAYREWRPAGDDAPWVLLLHGSPGSSGAFVHLGPALAERYRVVAPDLPGFGRSERRVPDYSIRAHAAYAIALLDRLGAGSVHVVGFSMGGGVALELTARNPGRVRSLTLLSSIGVVELELLGRHRLNHAIHGVQLVALWLLHEAVPHFGLLDGFPLDVAYARNFFDTDQRPLRRLLEKWDRPALIVHGARDFLVPVEAADEHHRLMPQSELARLDSDHFMVFRRDSGLGETIGGFLDRVEAGKAVERSSARPERIAAAARPFDPSVVPRATGVTLLVLVMLLAVATLVSEDLTCIAAGLLVAQGRIGLVAATLGCGAGIFIGDVLLFWAGRKLGRPWLGRRPLSWLVSPARVARSAEWFEKRGPAVIFLSRFLPGARFPTYFAAGMLPLRLRSLLIWFLLAVFVWTPLLVAVSSWVGAGMYELFEAFQRWALAAVVTVALVVWLLFFVLPRLATFAGRRRMVGWWRRWTRWEFWPPWLFYLPVVASYGWLALRYRSLTLFTAANPAIPAGGFVGESKADILARLPPESVARFQRVEAASPLPRRLEEVRGFVARHRIDLPVVLKPDVGERGRGVLVARSWEEVASYVATARADFLLQEFVAGREYGVFWARLPDEEKGRLFSITEKRLPAVEGDGHSTLEHLILADDRAVALADVYLERLAGEARRVPAAGETVELTDLGTHCRGAVFLDGARLATPELERAVAGIVAGFPGFFFGRFDLRVRDEEDLRHGRGLKVLELNGVTSEATSIYDPAHRLSAAYRTLFEQWRLAFEIGRRNRLAGAAVEPLRVLVRRILGVRLGLY